MKSSLSKALRASSLLLVLFTSLVASPAFAQQTIPNAQPIWVTLNASATGNYPGGDELFTVFAVNSANSPAISVIITNMTLTAPFRSNFAIGLPTTLLQGQSLLSTIHLEIPANFSGNTFTANLVAHATLVNGTVNKPLTITGSAQVNVLALGSSSSTTQTTTATGDVSMTTFELGVAVPSIIAILLLILLVQARGRSKRMGT